MISSPIVTLTRPATGPVGPVRLWVASVMLVLAGAGQAAQLTIDGPAGSGEFGRSVTVLPNGNIVVTDPGFDAPGPVSDVGAVYLYRPNGSLISTLLGSSAHDQVGSGGVWVLANGNFVVASPEWANGTASAAGAVTFRSGVSGVSGVVSPANSLVGSTAGDRVGGAFVFTLSNGNYVVKSVVWDNGATVDAGAVTFGSGVSGVSGVVTPANSLVGSTANDLLGLSGVIVLANGNYVVGSPFWENGAIVNAGAVTFGSGTSGISGPVSPANSLVGSTAEDRVGSRVTALTSGNYLVKSHLWDNGAIVDAGAVTFGSGATGIAGLVSPANSLVGSTQSDQVGSPGVILLANDNYVVLSENWANGAIVNAGAVTFGSGVSGVSGVVSPANSLVGSAPGDAVGRPGVTPLANGNYVVLSSNWRNGAIVSAGAATFGSGTSGISGPASPSNSLVGSTANDLFGLSVIALANGNYVVCSPGWDNGAIVNAGAVTFGSGTSGISGMISPVNSLVGSADGDVVGNRSATALANGNYVVASSSWANGAIVNAGAVTFGSGVSGISGVVSPANSLVGSAVGDAVGGSVVTPLANGNYVVNSPNWRNGAIVKAGAVTFGSGTSGISGVVSASNSLVGSTADDRVGDDLGVSVLGNGNYVVSSSDWDNGAIVDAGAVTFGSGTIGISGMISPANSLVGSSAYDSIGSGGNVDTVTALNNGHYVVSSPYWTNDAAVNAGAVTLGLSNGSVVGPISSTHSVLGTVAGQGILQVSDYDAFRNQLAVGQPASNRVALHRTGLATAISIVGDTPDPSAVGQPVTFTATISASPNPPTDGQVTFTASSGENCVDTTPTAISATSAEFSCTISFTAEGSSTVVAEYTGSIIHAYSGSGPETHTTFVVVFANGFESP